MKPIQLDKQLNRNLKNKNGDEIHSKGSSGSLRKYVRSPYLQSILFSKSIEIAHGFGTPKKNNPP